MILLLCSWTVSAQSKYIDSLRQIVSLNRQDTVELEALLQLSNEFSRKDISKARQFSLQVVALADPKSEVKWLTAAYNYLITMFQQTGQLDSARYYLVISEKLVEQNPTNVRIKFNYNQAAGLFYRNLGEYKRALPYVLNNVKIWKKEDENRAGQLLNLGNLYFNMGDFKNAADSHLKSLQLFEILKNLRGQSFCLQSLGNDLFKLRQLEQSKDYFQRSINFKKELKDKRGLINGWSGLADVYKEKNQFDLSEKYYMQALEGAKEMKLMIEEARCDNQLGLLYKRMGLLPKSQAALTRGLALARQCGDSSMSAVIHSELLGMAIQEQKEKRTENTLLSNLTTHINSGDRSSEATEYAHLAEYYASNNKFDIAFNYLKKHEQLKDSVEGNAVLLQIKELEERFQREKNEKEIALLKKDQELQTLALSRERANVLLIAFALVSVLVISGLLINRYRVLNRSRRLIEMERMRNTIARDLHDDVGSTLSSINIMSKLAMNNSNGSTHQQLERIAEHSAKMMESMSDIVWSINPSNDTLDQVITKMKEFAAEILEPKNISYSFDEASELKNLSLTVDKRKNIFLIFKEAINNAAKYSGSSEVKISIGVKSNTLHLSISDNGKGFDPATVKNGNGLKNMAARANDISGTIERKSEPGKGTEISVVVPIT